MRECEAWNYPTGKYATELCRPAIHASTGSYSLGLPPPAFIAGLSVRQGLRSSIIAASSARRQQRSKRDFVHAYAADPKRPQICHHGAELPTQSLGRWLSLPTGLWMVLGRASVNYQTALAWENANSDDYSYSISGLRPSLSRKLDACCLHNSLSIRRDCP